MKCIELGVLVIALCAASSCGQSVADPPVVLVLGLHGGYAERLAQAAEPMGFRVRLLSAADLKAGRVELRAVRLVLVQHLQAESGALLRGAVLGAIERGQALSVLALQRGAASAFDGAAEGPRAVRDEEASRRYERGGAASPALLAAHLARTYLGVPAEDRAPAEERLRVLHHPECAARIETLADYERFASARGEGHTARPKAAVIAHALHLDFQQPAVIDALVRALEKEGLQALVFVDGSRPPGFAGPSYEELIQSYRPDVMIHTCHSTESLELRVGLDCVHLHAVFFGRTSLRAFPAATAPLQPHEIAFQVTGQELLGAIEPILAAGTREGGGSGEAYEPIPAQVELLARRAAAWARLRTKPAAERRIAIVYWQREMGKAELMRGSATGMQLHGPRSALAILQRLEQAGVRVEGLPRDPDELIARLLVAGRQIGPWDQQGFRELLARGQPARVPGAWYADWLQRSVPAAQRAELERIFGPAPGEFMVDRTAPQGPDLIVPHLDLGHVVLLPQPLRGEAFDDRSLHDQTVPPPHHYLATYAWLQEIWRADVVIHLGTHGSEFMLPGKDLGFAATDWASIVLGSLPNVNPWVLDNLAEAAVAKRRAMAVTLTHLTAPGMEAGLTESLESLHRDLERWRMLPPGPLKERFAEQIAAQVRKEELEREIGLEPGAVLDEAALVQLDLRLHALAEAKIPSRLHVLGQVPTATERMDMALRAFGRRGIAAAVQALGGPLAASDGEAARIAARAAVQRFLTAHLVDGLDEALALREARFPPRERLPEPLRAALSRARAVDEGLLATEDELDGLIAATAGRFLRPGQGGAPERVPDALPTGRNMILVDPTTLPSEASMALGKTLAEELLARHATLPRRIAFDLSPFATFMDYGVMEGQIFHLLGVRPVRDEGGRIRSLALVPREELGRARVDVFLSASGYYRDLLPDLMRRLDEAVRLAASAEDAGGNPIRDHVEAAERVLEADGHPPELAARLARARLFGVAPGGYGSASYYYLVERSNDWDGRADLMAAYLAQVRHAYTEGAWGVHAPRAYDEALRHTAAVVRSWSDPSVGPLSNKYTWFKGGSLSLAVETVTGVRPEFLLNDVRDPDGSRLVDAEQALHEELRERLWNTKWLQAMMAEGYAGADTLAHTSGNVFGWKIMRPGSVSAATFDRLRRTLLEDELKLGLREWFEAVNPHARQEILEVLLAAVEKGEWAADPAVVAAMRADLAASVARHGAGGGLRSAPRGGTRGNSNAAAALPESEEMLEEAEGASPHAGAPIAGAPKTAPATSAPAAPPVRLQTVAPPPAATDVTLWWTLGLVLAVGALVWLGYRREVA